MSKARKGEKAIFVSNLGYQIKRNKVPKELST